jgi:hypothetical protein
VGSSTRSADPPSSPDLLDVLLTVRGRLVKAAKAAAEQGAE